MHLHYRDAPEGTRAKSCVAVEESEPAQTAGITRIYAAVDNKTLEQWQAHAGLGNSPRFVLEELRQVQSVDVVLPIVDRPEVKVRCVIRPNEEHAALLDRLGI